MGIEQPLAMVLGPCRVNIHGRDAQGDEVRLHRAGLVRVQDLQEWEGGSELGQALLGPLAVAVRRQRQTKLWIVSGIFCRRCSRRQAPP